ncbi:S8 family peptidase [Paenibacillus aurantius]|uniref:S8 family peptidase n=1 Tax=Paenibacillus aurantius TaxID=2918900 RepID=A0AA96LC46_9BACL|nr:S8 family peptidase [Paenibacillus aurantius]WNQ09361.1 S8 family peptidase [Paenibacillus aurantius]
MKDGQPVDPLPVDNNWAVDGIRPAPSAHTIHHNAYGGILLKSLSKLLGRAVAPRSKSKPVRRLVVLQNASAYHQCLKELKKQGIRPIKKIRSLHAILCRVHPEADIATLKKHPLVKRIDHDRRIRLHRRRISSPLLAAAACAVSGRQTVPWGISRIQAPSLWGRTTGRSVRVAVLDTGIAPHPDLKVAGSFNTIGSGPVVDDNGHGTHVAGTIGALNNSIGVVGAAPRVKLYAVKAFDRNGSAYMSDIIEGIDWCIRNNIQVINMSFGDPTYSESLRDIIRQAYKKGIIMVASAGNDGPRNQDLNYPARFPETIAVAASDSRGRIASFSSRGAGVDIAAPGAEICSTYPGGTYAKLDGTSMAAPHVSGTAALLLRLHPGMTPKGFRSRIRRSALKLKGYSARSQGSGLLQAKKAAQG